jgi:hypothetical protein
MGWGCLPFVHQVPRHCFHPYGPSTVQSFGLSLVGGRDAARHIHEAAACRRGNKQHVPAWKTSNPAAFGIISPRLARNARSLSLHTRASHRWTMWPTTPMQQLLPVSGSRSCWRHARRRGPVRGGTEFLGIVHHQIRLFSASRYGLRRGTETECTVQSLNTEVTSLP